MTAVAPSDDLALAIRLARAAGVAIEELRRKGFTTTGKADRSPVTEADLVADRIITEGLRAARPEDGILSEESPWVPGASPHDAVWCVDPIDGTEAYIDTSLRGYAVQIARLERDGDAFRPVLGVVFEPSQDELFAADRDGSLRFSRGGEEQPIAPPAGSERRVVMSTRAPRHLREALLSRGYGDAGLMRSVGVKVGHILLGHADIYPAAPGLAYWDLAAPQVILEAAGGTVTDLSGAVPRYRFGDRARGAYFDLPMVLTRGVDHHRVLADLQAITQR